MAAVYVHSYLLTLTLFVTQWLLTAAFSDGVAATLAL